MNRGIQKNTTAYDTESKNLDKVCKQAKVNETN